MAAKRQKTRKELEAEVRLLRRHNTSDAISKIAVNLIRYGTYAFISWQLSLAVAALSGKRTEANIDVSASGTLAMGSGSSSISLPLVVVALSIALAIGGITYGKQQAKLRREVVSRFHKYQKAEEKRIDPRRTSSRLTGTGDTRPEDIT
jgi:hypothetical protein